MKNKLNFYIIFYIIIVTSFFIWKQLSPLDDSLTISIAQYIVAFLLLVFFRRCSLVKDKIFPQIILSFIQIMLVVFFATEFYFTNFKNTPIVQIRFQDDPYEINSRVIRDDINRRETNNTLKVKRYPFKIDEQNIQNFIKKYKKEIIISGNRKFVHLYFRKKNNFSLGILNVNYKDLDLIIIEDVQNLLIPYKPKIATVSFITNLLYKLKDDKVKLEQTKYQEFIWENTSHKAYPQFLLGNYYLKDYVKSDNKTYLNCAIKYYLDALSYIRVNENPETFFATVNNLMVSYYLKYLSTTKIKYKKYANLMFQKNFKIKQKVKRQIPLDMRLSFLENRIIIKNIPQEVD